MGNDLRKQLEELKDQVKKLKSDLQKAYTDPLSSLWNRIFFEKFKKKIQDSKNAVGIIHIDANKLKHINDNFGHEVGDKYLQDMGKIIKTSMIRKSDFAFRLGGDEFLMALALTGKNPEKGLNTVLNRIESNLNVLNQKRIENDEVELSFAKGSAIKKQDDNLSETIQKAEKLMYEHKKLQKLKDPSLER